mmetsp:Transcript_20942/g.60057  ORF Transcript_20942/g.60057 Transcript_20942/m.60057 type:complete len:199 (-) Transcript_20942:677-1273(-)
MAGDAKETESKASGGGGTSDGPITVEAAVAEEICKELITSIAVEVAFDTHRMAKTGVLPLSRLMDPVLHWSNAKGDCSSSSVLGANKSRRRSSSFLPVEEDSEHGPQTKRSRSNTLASDGTGAGGTAEAGAGDTGDAAGTQQPVGADIWGRIPPKEPKIMPKCDICGRRVSALRFAVHLDKCMNLGNSRQTGSRRTAS